MPTTVDPITLTRLSLAKQFYNRALAQSKSFSVAEKMMSVILFDLSIELALYAIVTSLEKSKTPADTFVGLIQQSEVLLKPKIDQLPDRANILRVHGIRKDAQHDAKYPNESELSECQIYTRDFLKKIVFEVWGLEFDNISLIDLIHNQEVKQYLIDAEKKIDEKDYQKAAELASHGLQAALDKVSSAIVGSTLDAFSQIMTGEYSGSSGINSNVSNAFRRMQQSLLFLVLGLDYSNYIQYRMITGIVFSLLSGQFESQGMKENIDSDEARFVIIYSVDSVIQIENRVGNLDAPFGRSSSYWL